MPGCHHIKRWRASERELEGQMERETENYSAGRNLIVHQSKTEGKKLPLKLIIYPWEEKPQRLSPSLSLDVLLLLCVPLSVSWCQPSTRYQCLLLHIAIKATAAGSNPAFHAAFHSPVSSLSCTFYWLRKRQFSDLCVQVTQLAFLKA